MTSLTGDATFGNITIGQDASTLTAGPDRAWPADRIRPAGGHGAIDHVKQIAWSTSAGTFALNGLDMHVGTSGEECFSDPTP